MGKNCKLVNFMKDVFKRNLGMFDFSKMNIQSAASSMVQTIRKSTCLLLLSFFIVVCSASSFAGDLNISNSVLEITSGVESNIVILNDDSGSMDHGVMVVSGNDGNIIFRDSSYRYAHPDPGVTTTKGPAANIRDSGSAATKDLGVTPTEEGLMAQGLTLADTEGVWRAWHKGYNNIYYNPEATYSPWDGLNSGGTSYGNVTAISAPYNPYDASLGSLNLTATLSYITRWKDNLGNNVENLTINNFYPARYYTWTDTNTDSVVDASDAHTLYEIRSSGCSVTATCPSSFVRSKYDETTRLGRLDCGTDNMDGTVTCSYNEEIQNFANWFSYFRKRDLTAKSALSKVIEDASLARIGYTTLHNNESVNLEVASMNLSSGSGNKKALLDKVFSTRPDGGTPVREGLENLGRYFECKSGDIFGSSSDSSPGGAGCPLLASPEGTCQQNYAIVITDGFYNGSDPSIDEEDQSPGDTDTQWDGGAFAGDDDKTLADVAMYYYERDLHTTLTDSVPVTSIDVNRYIGAGSLSTTDTMHQHMSTSSLALGVNGSLNAMPSDPNVTFTWPDPAAGNEEKIDDIRHAAYNGRGNYATASDPVELAETLENIFEEMGTGEGASSSVAFNSQTIQNNSVVYRAFFNTKNDTGDLVAQRINPDGTLNVDVYGDSIFEWSAADKLDDQTSVSGDSRVIITYDDNGASSTGVAFRWSGTSSITTSQQASLDAPVPANVASVGDERLNYLRGQSADEGASFDDGQFRIRPSSDGKLGDIVHSTPVFVGSPPFTGRISGEYPGEYPSDIPNLYTTFKNAEKNRNEVVYVGANDGMMHAFDAQTGAEVFAYIPNAVFNNLSDLTDPDYSHRFYVDLTPSVNDVFMKKKGSSSPSWNSVLVGGLGAGGKGFYALNITDPSDFNTESNAADNVMWEFTEDDDGSVGNSDLGYSFSAPLIVMSNADTNGDGEKDWVAIFGNGYNSTSSNGDAAIYMAFLEAGQDGIWTAGSDYIKISTGFGKAESSDGTTPNGIGAIRGIDINADGTVDRLYAGDLQGNLYRIDVSSTTASNWGDSSNRDVIFKARYGTSYPRTTVQRITNRPVVTKHPTAAGYIVIFATGSWMTSDDSISTEIQSIYGIWDNNSGNEVQMIDSDNHLVEQIFTNHTSTEHGFTVRSLTNNAVNWKDTGNNDSKVFGWYIDLDLPPAGSVSGVEYPGERAVRNIQLRGDFVFMNTIIPKSSNPCNAGAGGFELAFDPITGGSGSNFIFDINADGSFDLDDNIGDALGDAYMVTGIRFDSTTPTDAAFIGNYRITQQSDKSIRSIGTNTEQSNQAGRTSWRELIVH